jgi:hypothetical protein
MNAETTRRKINDMKEVGWVRETADGIALADLSAIDLTEAAKSLGTYKRRERQRRLHRLQQKANRKGHWGVTDEDEEQPQEVQEDRAPSVYILHGDPPSPKSNDCVETPPSPIVEHNRFPLDIPQSPDPFVNMVLAVFGGKEVQQAAFV